jgi:hypothetical protein
MATTDIYHIAGDTRKSRRAVAFLGGNTDDYIQVNAAAAAAVAGNHTKGTITAWINLANITDTMCIVGAGDDNAVEFIELNVEAGLLTCRSTDATVAQFVTQADNIEFKPHRWYHVAAVQAADGNGVKLYVNGERIDATHDTSTDLDSWFAETDGIDTMRIGAANKAGDASVTNEFKGAISDVKLFSGTADTAALSASQVKDDYLGKSNTTSLQNHWDFDGDYVDAGSGADNGTAVGDVILTPFYSEFTSRLRYDTGTPVVADTVQIAIDGGTGVGHAVVIQAA